MRLGWLVRTNQPMIKTNSSLISASWFPSISVHSCRHRGVRILCCSLSLVVAFLLLAHGRPFAGTATQTELIHPTVTVVENGESKARPEDCRGIIVGPGINQPDPFPGYAGFVGWESPIRLRNGTWLVGFNAGYWHASVSTPMQYSPAHLQ